MVHAQKIALDQSYITDNVFRQLYDVAAEISKMLMGFYNYLTNKTP
jgi:hypothetical protein